jgi:teichuronic acid biosynthesis glycosyltransferase TuaC
VTSAATQQTLAASTSPTRRVLVLSGGSFPSRNQPVHGVFVKERVRFVAAAGVDVRVVSPVPYFPPIKWFKRWYPWSQVPKHDFIDGLEVFRPRYFLLPKFGTNWHSDLMCSAVQRVIHRQLTQFDFDLIDAHFAFPNGIAAVRLGKKFNKPVVITGRGEDIARFPDMPVIGPQIRAAICEATRLIAVSREIAGRMESFGADPKRITVIPNGVDTEKFCPVSQVEARQKLKLPLDRRIILAVGYRLELKGFHLLVDALPKIRETFPDAMVVIVGGEARWAADYLPTIQERIKLHGLQDHVIMAGDQPQDELRFWYSAADILSILSSREGSPNVLMESLACGLPAVATAVGGIPDLIVQSPIIGRLLPERSAQAAAAGLLQSLATPPDRAAIRRFAEQQSWLTTAQSVCTVFEQAIEEHQRTNSK